MPKFTDAARSQLIESGRGKGYGDITSREMGAMGGSTTKNLVSLAKKALEGDTKAIEGVTEDQVFIRKGNDAQPLELDVETTASGGADSGRSNAPEAQPRANVAGGNRNRSRQHA